MAKSLVNSQQKLMVQRQLCSNLSAKLKSTMFVGVSTHMFRKLIVASFAAVTVWSSCQTVQAGPLLDWLLGRRRANWSGTYSPTPYYPTVAGVPPTTCQTTWRSDLSARRRQLRPVHRIPNQLGTGTGHAISANRFGRSLHRLHRHVQPAVHDIHLADETRSVYHVSARVPNRIVLGPRDLFNARSNLQHVQLVPNVCRCGEHHSDRHSIPAQRCIVDGFAVDHHFA